MVNMNYYPACPNPELTVDVGRHSDIGTLTILLQDAIGGLYLKVEEDTADAGKKREWIEITPIPGNITMLGNGRHKSAKHRVRTTSSQSRVSAQSSPYHANGEDRVATATGGGRRFLISGAFFQDYINDLFGYDHDGRKSLDFARAT